MKKEGHDWCNDCCFLLFSLVRSDFEIAKWVNVNELFSSWKVINFPPPPPPQRSDNYIIVVWKKVLPKNTLILEQVQWSLSLLMVSVLSFSCLLMSLRLNNGQKNFHAIGQKMNQRNFIDKISVITTVESRTMVLFLILAIFFELPITRTVFDFPWRFSWKTNFIVGDASWQAHPTPFPHLREVE